jgi:hypothetical protein
VTTGAGILGVLAATASLSLCGAIALRLLPRVEPPLPRGARLSLAFLLGCGFVGAWRILLDLLGVRIGLLPTFAPAIPAAWLAVKRGGPVEAPVAERPGRLPRALGLATTILCALAIAETAARPLFDGDQVTNWGIKARVLHESGRLDFSEVPWGEIRGLGLHPPLAPALLALVHDFAGGVNNDTAKLFYAVFLLASLGLLEGSLAPFASLLARRAALLAFAATPVVLDGASDGLVDLPLAAFFGGGLLLLARGAAPAGFALTAFGVLLKAEGIALAVVNLAVAFAFSRSRPRRPIHLGALACAVAYTLWIAVRRAHGHEMLLPERTDPLFGPNAWPRALAVAGAIGREFVRFEGSPGWGPFLLLAPAAALALGNRLVRGPGLPLLAGFAGAILAQGAIYFIYPGDVAWQVAVHLPRAFLHGALAVAAVSALGFDACAGNAVSAGESSPRSR